MAKTLKLNPEQIQEIESAVFMAVEPLLSETFYLLDVAMEQEGGRWYLRIYVDKPGDVVSLDDCEAISLQAEKELDQLSILNTTNTSYVLEESSPGLFRTLRKSRELTYNKGQPVKVTPLPRTKVKPPINSGILGDYNLESHTVVIQPNNSTPVLINLSEKQFSIQLNPDIKFPED